MNKQRKNYISIDSVLRRIKRWGTKKSLATALGVVVFTVLMWGVSAPTTNAALGAGLIADASVAYGIFYVGAYLLFQLLSWGLTIVASFLDFAFFLNSYINPGQLAIVQEGWRNLRDLANGIFILLLLWIAITIVFNLDGLGGKKLLVRVIIVALLINFSLVMVSTVFAFGNELAKPFAKAMGANICNEQKGTNGKVTITCTKSPITISALIMQNSHLHEVSKVFAEDGVLESFIQAQKAFSQPRAATQPENRFGSLAQYLGAPPIAYAGPGTTITGASLCTGAAIAGLGLAVVGSVVAGGACVLLANFGIPIATAFLFHAAGWDVAILTSIFNTLVPSIFLFVTLTAMLTAAVILFLRLVAMVFLGVSAPIAFLGFAFPKFGERFWSVWLNNLFRWTAVTPIFYFLLYLALLMLQTNNINITATPSGDVPIMGNIYRIMNLVLFLVFLWAAVYITKKTAGHFADVALSLGRKAVGFGLGVGTGFLAAGAAKAALRGQKSIDKVSSSWIGRGPIGGMFARRTQAYIQQQKKRVTGRANEWEGTTEEFKKSQLAGAVSAENVTAISLAAIKDKQFGVFKGQEDRVVRLATRIGSQEEILKAFPSESDIWNVPGTKTKQEAVNKTLSKVDDLSKVSIPANASKDEERILLQGVLSNIKNLAQLQRIGRENTPLYNSLSAYWDDPAQDFHDLTTTIRQAIVKTGLTEAQAKPLAEKRVQDLNTYFQLVLANILQPERTAAGRRRRQREAADTYGVGENETAGGEAPATTPPPPAGEVPGEGTPTP